MGFTGNQKDTHHLSRGTFQFHSFQGSFFSGNHQKPRETAGSCKERCLKSMGNHPREPCQFRGPPKRDRPSCQLLRWQFGAESAWWFGGVPFGWETSFTHMNEPGTRSVSKSQPAQPGWCLSALSGSSTKNFALPIRQYHLLETISALIVKNRNSKKRSPLKLR